MKVEIIGIGPDMQEHAKELKKKIEEVLSPSSGRKKAKMIVAAAMAAAEEDGIDPLDMASVLLEMSAIIAYVTNEDKEKGRRTFKKRSGDAWDRAEDFHEFVKTKKQAGEE